MYTLYDLSCRITTLEHVTMQNNGQKQRLPAVYSFITLTDITTQTKKTLSLRRENLFGHTPKITKIPFRHKVHNHKI